MGDDSDQTRGAVTDGAGSGPLSHLSENDWQLIFDAIGHPTLILDREHRILEANRAAETKMNVGRGELRGRRCYEVFHGTKIHTAGCPLQRMLQSGVLETVDMEMEALGGTYLVSCTPVTNSAGELERVIHIATDITARKRAEAERQQLEGELRQAQKMEAVGRLAGGVAHDFNNALSVILSCSSFLKQSVEPDSEAATDVDEIQRAAERAASLTRQLLAFSRKQLVRPKALSVNDVVEDTERMLRRIVGEDVRVGTELAANLYLVQADAGLLEQVLVNLAVNARDAMPEGGRLSMRTSNVEIDGPTAQRMIDIEPGPHVLLEVSDDGVGMPEGVADHIFEPFFTTKRPGQGTGLGLSTVYGIIRQCGGHITVASTLGEGTTFRIYLPRLQQPTRVSLRPAATESLPPRGRVVLLVEDEAPLRKLLVRILQSYGHQVLEAEDAQAAMALLEDHRGPIHLLLTDLILPGPSGRMLAAWIAKLRPEMRVLYMSGYSDEIVAKHGMLDEDIVFLPKPFDTHQLNEKLVEALGTGSHRLPKSR